MPDEARNDPTLSSMELLERARDGDRDAFGHLYARYVPKLRRWASGRLPARERGIFETDDVVQEIVGRTLGKLDSFAYRGEGALLAYMRTALHNRLRDIARSAGRRPEHEDVEIAAPPDRKPSPLEELVGKTQLERYEQALARLREPEREAIVARIEMGLSYPEIMEALGKPSLVAARMAVSRSLARLAEVMSDDSW